MGPSAQVLVLALVAVAALALAAFSAWRPALGCAALMLLVPLTTGVQRGSAVPLLKPSELLVTMVVAGAVLHRLPRPRRQDLGMLDVVVATFVLTGVAVPAIVLLLAHAPADVGTWRQVLAPVQLAAIYLLFSRTVFSEGELRAVILLAMAGGAILGLVAVAELLDVPGLRGAVAQLYTTTPRPAWDTTYRPESLAGHYSALGAICLLNFILAGTLAGARHPAFPRPVLAGLMLANALGTIASLTFAPFIALLGSAAAIPLLYRRLPRELVLLGAALGGGSILLWPSLSARFVSQGLLAGGQVSPVLPESLATRLRLWSEFIVPALQDHLWLGTGTVIPATVPATLTNFVDNEYLWAGFRAGLPGVAVLLALLAAITVRGSREAGAADPWRRALGPAAGLAAASILVIGLTAQYLTFGGVVQQFGMLAGLLAGLVATRRPLRPAGFTAGFPPGHAERAAAADPVGARFAHSGPWLPALVSRPGWLWSRTRSQ